MRRVSSRELNCRRSQALPGSRAAAATARREGSHLRCSSQRLLPVAVCLSVAPPPPQRACWIAWQTDRLTDCDQSVACWIAWPAPGYRASSPYLMGNLAIFPSGCLQSKLAISLYFLIWLIRHLTVNTARWTARLMLGSDIPLRLAATITIMSWCLCDHRIPHSTLYTLGPEARTPLALRSCTGPATPTHRRGMHPHPHPLHLLLALSGSRLQRSPSCIHWSACSIVAPAAAPAPAPAVLHSSVAAPAVFPPFVAAPRLRGHGSASA